MNKQKLLNILKTLRKASVKNVRNTIRKADASVIRVLAEIALNIHKHRLGVTSAIRKGLLKFDSLLHEFGNRYQGGSNRLERNRQVLLGHHSAQGSGLGRFIRFLIKAALNILPQIVASVLINNH